MSATYPRVGCDNVFEDCRDWLYATSEETTYPVSNIGLWRPTSAYGPLEAAVLAGPQYVYAYPATGQLLTNGFFGSWPLGAAAAPGGWALSGVGAAVARGTTTPICPPYNAVLTGAAAATYMYQTITGTALTRLRGKQLTLGAYLKTATATFAYLKITDGTTTWTSSAAAGDGARHWVTCETAAPIAAAATTLTLEVYCAAGAGATVTVDGCLLVVGAAAACAATPHARACDYFAMAGHNLFSANVAVALHSSNDGSAWTERVASFTPSSDRAFWKPFVSASAAYWRITLTASTFSGRPFIACVAAGSRLEFPYPPMPPFNPYNEVAEGECAGSATNAPMGTVTRCVLKTITLTMPIMTAAQSTALRLLWTHAGRFSGVPFFFAWDDGDHPSEVWLCWLLPETPWDEPLSEGLLVDGWTLPMQAMVEQ